MKRISFRGIIVCVAVLLLTSCDNADEQSSTKLAVDLILHNGVIYAVDESDALYSAVVIKDGKVLAVGGEELLASYDAEQSRDLEGRFMIPGFNDSHTHISGEPYWWIDLTNVGSIENIKAKVAAMAKELGPGQWITGYGWSEDELTEDRRPIRDDLDEAAPENPVVLTRAGGHSAVSNTMALEISNVDENTPQPEAGLIEMGEDGRLNGIIRESQNLVTRNAPRAESADLVDSLRQVLKDQLKLGITSFTDASTTPGRYDETWGVVYANANGNLPRATVQINPLYGDRSAEIASQSLIDFGRVTGAGDEWLKVGPVKIFVDGGFTGPTAWTRTAYPGQPDFYGKLAITLEDLEIAIETAHNLGWQLGIHAIGDAAIEETVDRLVNRLQENPRADHRHYLNHFTVMPSGNTMDLMAENGIAITQQPNFTYTLDGRYSANLTGENLAHNNPVATPVSHGIIVALSSDVLPIGPLVGIETAVTRKGMSGRVYGPSEAITVKDAIRRYTLTSAWINKDEAIKGSLEPGKFADMIVLSDNLLEIDPSNITDTKILETWLGGKLVYENP